MRILLDECVPKKLRRALPGHAVRTVRQMGWSSQKNGVLLASMTGAGFEVLLTVDQGLRYEQNLKAAGVAVLVLYAASNAIADLLPLMPDALAALTTIQPGDVVEVHTP